MKDTEYDMLEALRDWAQLEDARRLGVVTKHQTDQALETLYRTCVEHTSDHNGEFPISAPDE